MWLLSFVYVMVKRSEFVEEVRQSLTVLKRKLYTGDFAKLASNL